MSLLELDRLEKSYGGVPALADLTLNVDEGESLVVLGPSGCGKTTALRLIAGFERPDSGALRARGVLLADTDTFVPPNQRRIGVVFQNYALWPHLSVGENVGFGLRHGQGNRLAKPQVRDRVNEALEMVQLGSLGDRQTDELSGGQQQRVSLARALVLRPDLLLLDEPLSNLDTHLRDEMRAEIQRLRAEFGFTMVYVTHDQTEALALADRIAVMRGGRLEQLGTPRELYLRPSSQYVARALGPVNVFTGVVTDRRGGNVVVDVMGGIEASLGSDRAPARGARVDVAARPSDLCIEATTATPATGQIISSQFLGEIVLYHVRLNSGGGIVSVCAPGGDAQTLPAQSAVRLSIRPGLATVLDSTEVHENTTMEVQYV